MRDQMDDCGWVENHSRFSADIDRLFDKIAVVFRTLVAIEYAAPWQVAEKRRRGATPCATLANCP